MNKLPELYSLSFDAKTVSLLISIRKSNINDLRKALLNSEEHRQKDQNIFQGFGKHDSFGYNNCINYHEEGEDYITFSYKILPSFTETQKICGSCEGKGFHPYKSILCFECHGNGKELERNENLYEGLLSLHPIFQFLRQRLSDLYFSKEPKEGSSSEQQMVIDWIVNSDKSIRGLRAWVSSELAHWLEKAPDNILESVPLAMCQAEKTISAIPVEKSGRKGFALSRGNCIVLAVPGNASSLFHDEDNHMFGLKGITFSSTNAEDNPPQHMALMVGMCEINRLWEKHRRSS